jgi:hypothetical protein
VSAGGGSGAAAVARPRGGAASDYEPAGAADDADIRRLLSEAPMEGRVRLAFAREPSYFGASRIEGDPHVTMVLRGPGGRGVLAMGSRSVRDVYVLGGPARLGYLAQLRWAPGRHPRRGELVRGFARIRSTRAEDELPFDLTSVAADNAPARRLLERGLPGLPRYTPLIELETRVLPVGSAVHWVRRGVRSAGRAGSGAPRARPARPDELAALSALLDADGRSRRLAPRWSVERLAELASGRLGAWEPLLLAQGSDVLGSVALWDQRRHRQVVVHSYDPALARLVRWLAPFGRLAGRPVLPPPGSVLPIAFASHLCAPDAAALEALLEAVLARARARGLRHLALALPAGDPALDAVRRSFGGWAYRTVLYVVHDAGSPPVLEASAPADVRVEVATL